MRFRIDDALWDGNRPDREREWQDALLDLNLEHDGHPPVLTLGRAADGGATITIERATGEVNAVHLSFDLLRDPFRDYREVIARLARADGGSFGMRDWESLDYAKKLVHDDAGHRLRKALRPHLEHIDMKLARRLFTIIFLVAVDLPAELVTRHRQHGP
ncbi:MAG TPA: UPF0262 family protein [Myxococcota bacterium]|nr:UPF0262 family protein [Myxococcota bacterium]